MSQIRRECPSDEELKKAVTKVLLTDPDMRFGVAVTMATRTRCMKKLEVRAASAQPEAAAARVQTPGFLLNVDRARSQEMFEGVSITHKAGFIHKELERICLSGPKKTTRKRERSPEPSSETDTAPPPPSSSKKAKAVEDPEEEQEEAEGEEAEAEEEEAEEEQADEPEQEEQDEQEDEEEDEDDFRSELEAKSRKELQALAKANGIKANLSSEKIINSLIEMQ